MTEQAPTVEAPDQLDPDKLEAGEYTGAEIQAYNEAKEAELADRVQQMEGDKQAAVETLVQDARDTVKTNTVTIGGQDIRVRERVPSRVERLEPRLEKAAQQGDKEAVRRLQCQMLAGMVVSPEAYKDPEVWVVASRMEGMLWLGEKTEQILESTIQRVREIQGNLSV